MTALGSPDDRPGPTWAGFRLVLREDLTAYGLSGWSARNQFSPRSRDRVVRWQRRLRLLEYLTSSRATGARAPARRLALAVLWRRHERTSAALGFTIPLGVFGPGLQIAHYGTITVNTRARVGRNCRIHPSTTIAGDDDGAPHIGDDAYIGPGVRVIGNIRLGRNVVIGANAVVTRSFDEDDVVLVGVPATIARRGVEQRWRH